MISPQNVHASPQQQIDLARATMAKLGVETAKLVDQLRWYPWIIFGSVVLGLATGGSLVVLLVRS
jgi:hypothetical protein